jgi:ABC-type polysaccharide/polyol phosphate export permease
VALRLQSRTSGTLILLPVYVVLFLTPVFVERDQLSDWLQAIAGVNPLTAPIEAGRGLLADDPVSVGLAFAAAGALLVALTGWAVLGMRKAGQKG